MGHHPITNIRCKKKKSNSGYAIKTEPVKPTFIDLWNTIRTTVNLPDMNYYYLCADTHMYQKGVVTVTNTDGTELMNITQYIVGTGGADLDDNPYNKITELESPYIVTDNKSGYTIKYETKSEDILQSYGFLECESNDRVLSFQFIPIGTVITTGGKLTRKRRVKRRNRKSYKRR